MISKSTFIKVHLPIDTVIFQDRIWFCWLVVVVVVLVAGWGGRIIKVFTNTKFQPKKNS